MDGTTPSRRQVRHPAAVEGPRVRRTAMLTLGGLHRRQRRDLRGRQLGAAAAAAGARTPSSSSTCTTPIPGPGVEGAARTACPTTTIGCSETDVFQEQALYNTRGVTLGGNGDRARHRMVATPSLLRLLQVQPVRGRDLHRGRGGNRQDEQGDPDLRVVAAVVRRAGQRHRPGRADQRRAVHDRRRAAARASASWIPRSSCGCRSRSRAEEKSDDNRHSNNWSYVARLQAGRDGRAGAPADRRAQRAQPRSLPASQADPDQRRVPHRRRAAAGRPGARRPQHALSCCGAASCSCCSSARVNVTNLMLVRSSARMKELATRHALGAGLGAHRRPAADRNRRCSRCRRRAPGLALGYGWRARARPARPRRDAAGHQRRHGRDGRRCSRSGSRWRSALLIGLMPILSLRHMNLSQVFREEGRSRHGEPRRARRPPRARDRAGRVRVHAAHRRRPAARELPAGARGRPGLRRQRTC